MRIKVRPEIVAIPQRCGKFPAQAEVQSELRRDAPVVLNIKGVDMLTKIRHQVGTQCNLAGETEIEIGEVVTGGVSAGSAAG